MADLISAYDIPAHRLRAVQFGIGQRFMRVESHRAADIAARYGLDGEPYILAVGTLQPRKNYPRLIEAVRRLRESGQSVRLAIAGPKGWLIDGMPELAGDAQPDFVRLLGEVPDDDLPALYSAAICFAMPSLYEGFGLPILEAMACGVPVVTSNTSSLPEAAGDAALLVDPRDVDDLTSALKQLLVDKALRESLTSKGLLRVNGLSWDLTARQLQDAFDFALANPRTR